jgi:NhaP-type Na+/H+ or K+/H+ antiporter
LGLRNLRADAGLCLRLLGIGLPLTDRLGTLLALALPGYGDIWLALLVGAALAPTDAALGASMMVNPAVPARIRRLINVESGLNDGIATPVVLVAIAAWPRPRRRPYRPGGGAGGTGDRAGDRCGGWCWRWLADQVWPTAVAGWPRASRAAAVLGLAACCYATSVALHGNGFIAAFVGGLGFAAAGREAARFVPFVEETGALVSLLVWLLFGVIAVVPALESLTWQTRSMPCSA